MYQGKKISVAMATYNGERFLEQQLDSILEQTVLPDEIIISDDGSGDRTLEIAKRYAEENKDRVQFVILTDNPRHGIGGNFTWSIGHSTGDYIFICGQDDLWEEAKVAHVVDVFIAHPQAELVCHKIHRIDQNNKRIPGDDTVLFSRANVTPGTSMKILRQDCLESAVSGPIVAGNAICISACLCAKCLPIPLNWTEDQWLEFCAAADDQFYYLDEDLTAYRIHNSATHVSGLHLFHRVKKYFFRLKTPFSTVRELTLMANAAEIHVRTYHKDDPFDFEPIFITTGRIREIGGKQIDAARSGRLQGAIKLTKLFLTDARFRRSGAKLFLFKLFNILLFDKKTRRKQLYLNEQEK